MSSKQRHLTCNLPIRNPNETALQVPSDTSHEKQTWNIAKATQPKASARRRNNFHSFALAFASHVNTANLNTAGANAKRSVIDLPVPADKKKRGFSLGTGLIPQHEKCFHCACVHRIACVYVVSHAIVNQDNSGFQLRVERNFTITLFLRCFAL